MWVMWRWNIFNMWCGGCGWSALNLLSASNSIWGSFYVFGTLVLRLHLMCVMHTISLAIMLEWFQLGPSGRDKFLKGMSWLDSLHQRTEFSCSNRRLWGCGGRFCIDLLNCSSSKESLRHMKVLVRIWCNLHFNKVAHRRCGDRDDERC